MSTRRNRRKAEFGDFQTPPSLARKVCALLSNLGVAPASMLEPTCGEGNFIMAALTQFGTLTDVIGLDINRGYIDSLAKKLDENPKVEIAQSDFFDTDWTSILDRLPVPLLILGNPPWVTNSALATLGSGNLPQKSNFQNHTGLEAITGASNFDISEWMLINLVERVRSRDAAIAMLCKTAVARKVLLYEWQSNPDFGQASLFLIDAQAEFGAAVDACLFVYNPGKAGAKSCGVYSELSPLSKMASLGYEDDQLIANVEFYQKWKHLQTKTAEENHFAWRSGIKHDCAKVMEFTRSEGMYVNNLGVWIEIEDTLVYPMMKSSDVANGSPPSRFMLVPQRSTGQETKSIRLTAPKTWTYMVAHQHHFERRKSAIYRNRPQFSIFGVGDYSFSTWKVAISGLYKRLAFVAVGPHEGKPVVLDDTCYFLACRNEEEARLIATLFNSEPATEFFSAFIFWDAKRPITAKILKKLDILALAQAVFEGETVVENGYPTAVSRQGQLRLLEERVAYGGVMGE